MIIQLSVISSRIRVNFELNAIHHLMYYYYVFYLSTSQLKLAQSGSRSGDHSGS